MTNVSSEIRSSRKSQMMALLVSAVLFPLSGAQGQSGGASEVTPADLIRINSMKESSGNGGGPWVVENSETVNHGEITRIRVCHGRFINRISALYSTTGQGKEFGGPGGNCDDFNLSPGEFVREVRTWNGDWMNAIQFVASDGKESKVFGDPAGGTPQSFIDPDGGALRQIDGKYGAYLNQARFSFGLPFKLKDFKIEIPAGAYNPGAGELREIEAIKANLCEFKPDEAGDAPSEISKGFSKSVSDSHKFSFGSSTTFGLEVETKVGFPGLGDVGITVSAEQAFTFGIEDATETTNTRTEDFKFFLPNGRAAEAVFTARAHKLNVPFTYKLVHYSARNPGKEIQSKTYRGTYEGVLFGALNVSVYEVDCATGERKKRFPDGATLPSTESKPVEKSFSGSWSCPPYGTIDINQSGTGITGKYSWGGVGTFQGDAKDRFMRVSVNDSAGKPLPSFFWELTLSGDGNRVDGKIIDKTESAAWGCSRIGAP